MSEVVNVSTWKRRAGDLLPGLLLTLVFAAIAFVTWWFLKGTWLKFSALLGAFIYSIIAGNLFPVLTRGRFSVGIDFSSGRLLRWVIALLGLTISAAVWAKLGGVGIATVLINLTFVFIFGFVFCRYVLRLSSSLAVLLGVGTSICGASAIAAIGPAIRAKAEEMGLAVATITLFGLVAMFTYPLLFTGPLVPWLGKDAIAYGMWTGTGVHEAAQVIAAASQIDGALSIAASAKFIRILMIGPMVFFSQLVCRRFSGETEAGQVKLAIPWFAVFFVIFTFVHFGLEQLAIRDQWLSLNSSYLTPAVSFLLAWAFAAIGFKVKISTIRKIGLKATLGGVVVALVAGGSALLLTKYFFLPFYK
ncbi:MAG: putative sulfate exporter family transporter [Chloroflexi bacterium]|nr:putative sulfate exporter family transporter [Chloroflexota bacterium]